jgi:hypothetical protein
MLTGLTENIAAAFALLVIAAAQIQVPIQL